MKKFACLSVFLALLGCADGEEKELDSTPPPQAEIRTERLICPQVAILREAESVVDYGGEQASEDQVVAKARLAKIDGDCAYRKDEDKPSGIDIQFKLKATALRGPRLGGDSVSFPYFIAVVDPSDKVLSREVVTAKFRFSGSDAGAEIDESLHVFIPMPVMALNAGPDYRVLTGFLKK